MAKPNTTITLEQVFSIYNSEQQYPVDFTDAWQWLGYTRKDNALRVLKANFQEHFDYSSLKRDTGKSSGGMRKPSIDYYLTSDCFRLLAMLAQTDQGKQVRLYYLECEKRLKQMMAGRRAESGKPKPYPVESLPPADVRVANLYGALRGFGIDTSNPRFKQELQDLVMDRIIGTKTLPPSQEDWLSAAEKAERMGYPVRLVTHNRSQLGKYVKARSEVYGLRFCKEKRLCNGTQRLINLYLDCENFGKAVAEFMDSKV